jgi:AraC-like DNA-binding protein
MPTDLNTPPVSTLLTPEERSSVEAAGEGVCEPLHRNSIDEVGRDIRERRAAAMVVSVARCVRETMNIETLVREFPRIPAIALVSITDPEAAHVVLTLGQCGVRTLIDLRSPDGFRSLRQALVHTAPLEVSRLALDVLAIDLGGIQAPCWNFFDILFTTTPPIARVGVFADRLDLSAIALASRLYRLRLPPARSYLGLARLTRAARLLENPGLSIANVSNFMEFSSPQAFSRHLGVMLDLTASKFRRAFDGPRMLELFRQTLVMPYLDQLRRLDTR